MNFGRFFQESKFNWNLNVYLKIQVKIELILKYWNCWTLFHTLSPDNHGSGDHETTTTTIGSHDNHEGGKVECDFSNVNDVDGQLYTIDDVETNEAGILKFEFDQNVMINVSLVEEPDITFDCTNGICKSNVAVGAGDWTVEVKNSFYGDDGTFSNGMFYYEMWDTLPLIKTYFVDDKNYCEGEVFK